MNDLTDRAKAPMSASERLALGPMSTRQIIVIMLCLLINAVDGFDVQVTAFTAPAIAAHWNLRPDVLGMVLSAGLFGMGIGALLLSPIGDIYGRKPLIVGSLLIVALGMLLSTFCGTMAALALARLFTGFGIGGLISSVGTMVAEFSSDRRRGLVLGLMAISFPAGAMLCAAISAPLINRFGWQSVFLAGAIFTALIIPLIMAFMPESILFLMSSRRARAKEKLASTLRVMSLPHAGPTGEEERLVRHGDGRFSALILGDYRWRSLNLGGLFLCSMLTFYFILNWAPKLVVEAGAPMGSASMIGLLINMGGLGGGIAAGLAIPYFGLKVTGRAALLAMAVTVVAFGALVARTNLALALGVLLGFSLWAVQACIYTAMMVAFPAQMRATAVGLVTTAGRIGSALGPLLGGLLLSRGFETFATSTILVVPAIIAAIIFTDFARRPATEAEMSPV